MKIRTSNKQQIIEGGARARILSWVGGIPHDKRGQDLGFNANSEHLSGEECPYNY